MNVHQMCIAMQIAFGSCFLQSKFINIKTFIIFFLQKEEQTLKNTFPSV